MQLINSDSQVVNVPPDIPKSKFVQVLKDANSPALVEASASYDAVVKEGLSPAFILAIFFHESRLATDPQSMVVIHGTHNPGNCRTSRIGVKTIITTERGNFVKYDSWEQGFRDCAVRLKDKNYVYAQEGRATITQIIERWAPKGDFNNNPDGYINTVISLMNQWIGDASTTMKDPTNQVNLIPGHAGRGRGGVRPKL
jgi:hypothetical protein